MSVPKVVTYQSQDGPCAIVSGLPMFKGTEWTRLAQQVELAKRLVLAQTEATAVRLTSPGASDTIYVWFT